ncbi:MAG: RNA 2',3'-cyclic phosphodiesterase [Pirellulaceae bacterium]|nr:RNA 2',3'-cyclic phosphodiesterase [Pirellulaceae bacterium]
MARIRTFVALELAPDVCSRAGELIAKLRASQAQVSWVPPDRMHLTLKFLGEVPEQDLADVCRVVADVCRETPEFDLRCGGAGAFPNVERPRTVWLGVSLGEEPLEKLQAAVERALGRLGFRQERRRYQGHLTLGRVRGAGPELQALGALLRQYADFQTPVMLADEVRVYGSYLDRTGPTYEVLGSCPLSAAP